MAKILTELEFREAMKGMDEAALWDVRRMTLAAARRDQAVPVRYFEEAVSEGLRGLPRRTLENMWDELQKHPLGKQSLRTLAQEYKPARMVAFEEDDLRKASVMFWESLQHENDTVREALTSYDYGTACKELAAASKVLNRELLVRLVYIKCPAQNVIEEVAYMVLKCTTNELKMMAGKFYERLDKTAVISEENKEIATKIKNCATKEELQSIVLELLKLFPRYVPDPNEAGAVATVTVSYQGKQRQVAALVRIERLKPIEEEGTQAEADGGEGGGGTAVAGSSNIVVTMGGGKTTGTASVISVSVPASNKSVPVSVKSVPASTRSSKPASADEPITFDTLSNRGGSPRGDAATDAGSVAHKSTLSMPVSNKSVPQSTAGGRLTQEPEDIVIRSKTNSVKSYSVKSHATGTKSVPGAQVEGNDARSGAGSVARSAADSHTSRTTHTTAPVARSSSSSSEATGARETKYGIAPSEHNISRPASVANSSATSRTSRTTPVAQQSSKHTSADGAQWDTLATGGAGGLADSSNASESSLPVLPPSATSVAGSVALSRTSKTTPAAQTPSRPQSEVGDQQFGGAAVLASHRTSNTGTSVTSHDRNAPQFSVPPPSSKKTSVAGDQWNDVPVAGSKANSVANSSTTSSSTSRTGTVPPLPVIVPSSPRPASEAGRTSVTGTGPQRSKPSSEAGNTWDNQDYGRAPEPQSARGSVAGSVARSHISHTSRTTPPVAQSSITSRQTSQAGIDFVGATGSMHGESRRTSRPPSKPASVAGSVRSNKSIPASTTTPPKSSRPPSEAATPWWEAAAATPVASSRPGSVTSSHTSRVTPASAKFQAEASEGSVRSGKAPAASGSAAGKASGSFHGSISFARDGASSPTGKNTPPKSRAESVADPKEQQPVARSSRPGSVANSTASALTTPYNAVPEPPAPEPVYYQAEEQPNEQVARSNSMKSSKSSKSNSSSSSSSNSSSKSSSSSSDSEEKHESTLGSEKGDPWLSGAEPTSAASSRSAKRTDSGASHASRKSASPSRSDRF